MTKNPDEILRMLDSWEIQAVWNDRLVGIGIDLPNLANCYHVGHSHSLYRLLQELGRITRKGDGDKTALAVNVCASGTDPYLYEDVLGGSEVESRERQVSEDRRVGRSSSGETRRENLPYMHVPNIRVYASRADRQTDSPVRMPPQQETHRAGAESPDITEREKEAAVAQEQSMTEERQQVITQAEQQLRERAASNAREDIFNTSTIVDFVNLLLADNGLSLRELSRRLGYNQHYLNHITLGHNTGSSSREIILPFLRRHYPELAEHFDRISSITLPVAQLLGTENAADFFRILRDAHPRAVRGGFYDTIEIPFGTYGQLVWAKYTPSLEVIGRFRPYLRKMTGSDEVYQHLVSLRNDAAKPSVSLPVARLLKAENPIDFLRVLRDAHPRLFRQDFYDAVDTPVDTYSHLLQAHYLPSQEAVARFGPYLRKMTGSDEVYQHLVSLCNEAVKARARHRRNSLG